LSETTLATTNFQFQNATKRGSLPTLVVAITLLVTASIIDTLAELLLDTTNLLNTAAVVTKQISTQ
jgi:hypothetical protein